MSLMILVFSFCVAAKTSASKPAVSHSPATPQRLLFMVFDQMRPDYVDRFDLKNFKRLRKMGTNYQEAYVGHLGSLTIVSHPVMTTGLQPKNLPWADNFTYDRAGIFGEKEKIHHVLSMSQEELLKGLSSLPSDIFFVKRFKEKMQKKVFAIGEKHYSTITMGGPFADSIIYMKVDKKTCEPTGVNVPDYLSANKRFVIDCEDSYGTENSLYGLDGNRFYPGKDSAHQGGDVWVADTALEVMRHEKNWGALFLTFGAIDRFGHMLGSPDGDIPISFKTPATLKDIAQVADEQLGKLLQELEKENLLDSTLIISTADHGGQTDEIYLGTGDRKGDQEPFWIGRLAKLGKIRLTSQDTGLRVWLMDQSEDSVQKALPALKEISKVTHIFALDRKAKPIKYKEVYSNLKNQTPAFQKWAKAHDQELVDSFANESSADLVAAFADGVGFGKLGDHGGFQEKVQRIPLFVVGPGFKKRASKEPLRLVDLEGLMSKAFQLPAKPAIQ